MLSSAPCPVDWRTVFISIFFNASMACNFSLYGRFSMSNAMRSILSLTNSNFLLTIFGQVSANDDVIDLWCCLTLTLKLCVSPRRRFSTGRRSRCGATHGCSRSATPPPRSGPRRCAGSGAGCSATRTSGEDDIS